MNKDPPDKNDPPPDPGEKPDNRQPRNKYYFAESDRGPFLVMVESSNKSIGNYHHLSIAKNILELKLDNIKKFERKGINRI